MSADRHLLRAASGQPLEVLTAGPDDGLPLVFHPGTPAGPVAFPALVAAATARGLRTVQYARPGYGRSATEPGRRVAGAAADVAAVLDQLGADRFITAGWSGGGPHALACAALLPGRCLAAASLAGVAPATAAGLDWLAGMGPENIAEFGAARQGETALTVFLDEAAPGLGQITSEQVAAGLGGLASDADRAVISGGFADYLAAAFRAALASGIAGWRDDDLAFVAGWGFGLDGMGSVPVAIWQGDQDLMVPYSHGQWLAERLPGARAHLCPGEGHLSLVVQRIGDVLDDLLGMVGLPPGAGRVPGRGAASG
jgi:pimeloyl-ACP methyl ester carboxylesterase